jgi:predicted metalloprotease
MEPGDEANYTCPRCLEVQSEQNLRCVRCTAPLAGAMHACRRCSTPVRSSDVCCPVCGCGTPAVGGRGVVQWPAPVPALPGLDRAAWPEHAAPGTAEHLDLVPVERQPVPVREESRWRSVWFFCSTAALAIGGFALLVGAVLRDVRPYFEPDASRNDAAATVAVSSPTTSPTTVAVRTVHHLGTTSETFGGATDAFIADIETYWNATLPAAHGTAYRALEGGIWPASADTPLPTCGTSSAAAVTYNAFYCSGADFIAYDDRGLFTDMASYFDTGAIGVVLAHEWGHAIQARINGEDLDPIVLELQADCFAGSWAQDAIRRGGVGTYLTAENLHRALGAVILLGDAEGTTAADAGAHGSGFDRIASFLAGYQQGAQSCFAYRTTPPATFQLPWGTYEEYTLGGDLPLDALIPGLKDGLRAYLEATGGGVPPVISTDGGADCPVEGIAAWCAARAAVVVDTTRAGALLADVGDMAIGYAIAEAYFDHLGDRCGAADWVAWLRTRSTTPGTETFTLSPGDLDEALLYLLYFSPTAPADLDGAVAVVAAFQQTIRDGTCR